ncbi:hypothetical protein SAMN05216302_101170 [Nitrosomonas aestuarii]|uniref:Uncharacterized protein n=1 Tax=Nitrosomonas aestuarii TaxID=52441 RepID=A0A1I4B771_9PROT|nr:hypothetical protein [Nitrosomonas aestuarii]SFK64625.1 hypothetical protein SAMN05216302_101170 [Nitrosomonas aestuarii]
MLQKMQILKTNKGYIHRADGPEIVRPKPTKADLAQLDDLINHCIRSKMSNEVSLNIIEELDMMLYSARPMGKRISRLRAIHNGTYEREYKTIPADKVSEVDALIREGLSEGKTGKQIMSMMTDRKLNFLSDGGNFWRIRKVKEKMADEALAKESGNANW